MNSFNRMGTSFFWELLSITILWQIRIIRISYLCEILDDLKMKFETHHYICLPTGQCWHMTHILNFYLKKKKKRKGNLMSTLDIRDVLDGISQARSMKVYLYIWNFTRISICGIEETTKHWEKLGDLLLLLLLFTY